MLVPLLLTSVGWAADVLIPEATPESLDDFAVAAMVYDLVLNETNGGLYRVEDGDRIRVWAGPDADGCFDTDACPANLWARTDARVALVLGVGKAEKGVSVTARFYDATHAAPIREIKDVLPEGTELAFAKDVAMALSETLASVPARASVATAPVEVTRAPPKVVPLPVDEEEELARPRRTEDLDDTPVTKERKPVKVEEEEEVIPDFNPTDDHRVDADEEKVDAAERDVEERDLPSARELGRDKDKAAAEQASMKLPDRAYANYVESGLGRDEWLAQKRVRSFGFFVEGAGGYALWDTDRAYGVWVDLDDQDGNYVTTAASTWEGSGTGPDGGGGPVALGTVGVTVTWWFEVSASAGIQQGRKYLEAGYECTACEESLVEVPYEPVVGTQLWVQPRLRFIPVVAGVLKPYAVVSADLAFYDGFVPSGNEVIDFPSAEGGMNWGIAGGLGMFVDATPHVSFFAEVPISVTLSPLWRSFDDPGVATQPQGIPGQGAVLRLLGGVSIHF